MREIVESPDRLYATRARDGAIFIRPDSGEKEFTGSVVVRECFNDWKDHVQDARSVPPDTLCVVSTPVTIHKELRLIVSRGRVITGSTYRVAGERHKEPLEDQPDAAQMIAFAERVLADSPPLLPPVNVLDVAEDEHGLSLMEVGCWCCAGLYESDRLKLAHAVSEAAEEQFQSPVK